MSPYDSYELVQAMKLIAYVMAAGVGTFIVFTAIQLVRLWKGDR